MCVQVKYLEAVTGVSVYSSLLEGYHRDERSLRTNDLARASTCASESEAGTAPERYDKGVVGTAPLSSQFAWLVVRSEWPRQLSPSNRHMIYMYIYVCRHSHVYKRHDRLKHEFVDSSVGWICSEICRYQCNRCCRLLVRGCMEVLFRLASTREMFPLSGAQWLPKPYYLGSINMLMWCLVHCNTSPIRQLRCGHESGTRCYSNAKGYACTQ